MAVRLNVVMNQSPPASPTAQRVGEGIVGELIGRPGIDMALVNTSSLEDAHSTDLLTLESMSGDFVYLDWKAPEDVLELLVRCGIGGKRTQHPGDLAAPKPSPSVATGRKIYIFDLNQYAFASEVCRCVYELLALRQVRTFSLSSNLTPAAIRKPPQSGDSCNSSKSEPLAIVSPKAAEQINSTSMRHPIQNPPPGTSSEQNCVNQRLNEDQLDALVDALNSDELG
jgi:hypothetical protein